MIVVGPRWNTLGRWSVAFIFTLASWANADDLPAIKKAAVEAAQRRQDLAQQWDVEFTTTPAQQLPPEMQMPMIGATIPPPRPSLPKNRLVVAGSSIRYEDNSYIRPFRGDNLGLHSRELSTFNGVVAKRYFPDVQGAFGTHLGFLVSKGPPRSIATPLLLPLLYNYRARDPYIATVEIDAATPTNQWTEINQRRCRVFMIDLLAGREILLWLDPERDYVPYRVSRNHPGQPVWQVDMTYAPHPVLGWVPDQWLMKRYGELGHYFESWQATLVTLELNKPAEPTLFELDFASNTQVQDEQTNQQFIVQDDGNWREISPVNGRYLDELPTPSEPFPRYGYLIFIAIIATLALVANRFRRRSI